MTVTLYKATYVAPKSAALSAVIEMMRSDAKKKLVLACRKDFRYTFPGTPYPETKMPPLVLYSALFGKEPEGGIVMKSYTGIVLVEVDNLAGGAEVARIRRKASESLQTLAAFTGLSGRSVKILIRFALPGHQLPQTRAEAERFHAHAYLQAADFYRMQLGRKVTLKPSALERGCRLSYDPDLYYNPDALVVTMGQPLREPSERTWEESKETAHDPLDRLMPEIERDDRLSFLFDTSLKETMLHFGGFHPDNAKLFLVRMAENCCRSGIPEADTVAWAMHHTSFEKRERELRETVSNVYLMAEHSAGAKPCLPHAQVLSMQLEHFMRRRYEFRRNELKKEVEYYTLGSPFFHFRPVTDEVMNTISLEAHAEGLGFWDRDVKRYIHSNRVPLHNPLDYYLSRLPEWDGTDHIRALARTLPTKNPLWPDLFYRWFLGMVAQWKQLNRLHGHSVLPLLTGEQGCGKSTWCRNLMPRELRDYYTDSLDFSSKREAELALHRFALINLDEFDSIGANYMPYLKHLIQKPEINTRRPYKSSVQSMKRYGVFIATCNNMDLLTDPTGSRRFLCIEIEGQIDRRLKINHNQLYAQAMATLFQSERYWFNAEEEKLIVSNNKPFEQVPVEEQLLNQYFLPAEPGEEGGEWMPPILIIQRLQERGKMKFGNLHVQRFVRILRKNNFPYKHTNQGSFYCAKEVWRVES
ncbi:MAG: DUF3874 domain-containing protein [Tannerellaceae bacterium]|jgi:hypothetical protein|nr:DUF3874 domain-containing protein [Tannerellaceae bacterium]